MSSSIKKKTGDYIKDLEVGPISIKAAIYDLEVRQAKTGKKYLYLRLGDKTDVVTALYFTDNEREVDEGIRRYHVGQVVEVSGLVDKYKKRLNIKIKPPLVDSLVLCSEDEFDLSDYRSVTEGDVDVMLNKINDYVDDFKNPYLKKLCLSFLDDPDFMRKFNMAPGAQSKHHNYAGGLLEHTLEMLELGEIICGFHSELDRDLLFSGIILHDVGKLDSYRYRGASIERTDEEKLIGHIVLGDRMVWEKMNEIKDFPEELKLKISHLILSHHGEIQKGYGSAVNPGMPEAHILHHIDNADSQIKLIVQKM